MPAERLFSRAVIRLSADSVDEDVAAFLQGLVTNDVTGLLPVWSGLLTPQGKVLFDFLVWPGADGRLLDCEARVADDLVRRLSLYRLRRKIAIARDESLGIYWQADLGDGGALSGIGSVKLVRNGLMSSPPRRVYRAYTANWLGLHCRRMSMKMPSTHCS